MSFASTITLTPSSGVATTSAVARAFDEVSFENYKKIRSNSAAGLATPQLMTISHQLRGSGVNAIDAHMIRFDQKFAAAGVIPEQGAFCYTVIGAPRNTVTVANMQDLMGLLVHFTNNVTNLAKLLNNEP